MTEPEEFEVELVRTDYLQQISGEITQLRGLVGDLLIAYGAECGVEQAIEGATLREILNRHGIVRDYPGVGVQMVREGFVCIAMARQRGIGLPH